ncbi:hypothetical protein VCRA2120O252_370001 [Vibrio crassostreae]|nr:hypothetical protein VCRA2120O252_370001 [Vibrio crassostreae]
MQARIKIETLLEQQPTSTMFSPPSRSVVIDGEVINEKGKLR